MRDAIFGRLQCAVENFASVATGEVAGFRNGMEDLGLGGAVNREIVDRFMGDWIIGDVWGQWEHSKDAFGVGESDGFSLNLTMSDPKYPRTFKSELLL